MCKFFSAISDGKGKVLFFTLKDIQKIEKENNPENYEWNSHTSIASYFGIKGEAEDNWNKWEYDCEKKELEIDGKLVAANDSIKVKAKIEKYLSANNAIYVQKIYLKNTGDRNTGDSNTGDSNTGHSNTGDSNTGHWNTGHRNTGHLNTITPKVIMFNKPTNLDFNDSINFPNYFYFSITDWISVNKMTDEEKKTYWWYKTTEGYLRKIEYKEAWLNSFKKASKIDVAKTLKLPNFNYKIFEEISGITKKMIDNKLKGE